MNAGLYRHRLVVEADAHPNLMLRLLEPFAVHDVQPTRIRLDGPPDGRIDPYTVEMVNPDGSTAPFSRHGKTGS